MDLCGQHPATQIPTSGVTRSIILIRVIVRQILSHVDMDMQQTPNAGIQQLRFEASKAFIKSQLTTHSNDRWTVPDLLDNVA